MTLYCGPHTVGFSQMYLIIYSAQNLFIVLITACNAGVMWAGCLETVTVTEALVLRPY